MLKLSVVIPSRDERFLTLTIDDIFRNARGEIEVVAVLDSDKWPLDWKEVTARHPNLHTIHNGSPLGMRASINRGVASAISRGATYIAKSDAHCSFSEGFDEVLKTQMDDDWIVVPRRLRLDAEKWTIVEPEKPPYDYHYLSFPNDPNDFGGAGLNGKPWPERQKARADILLDEEMSSQGSFWAMKASYFQRMGFMDELNYGPFWNEMQELALCCWLSGGKVMVNKQCHYLHLHKGKVYGRGYRLPEKWLKQGREHTMKWPWNEAWSKQTLPFKWLIDHFWPVPTWPENWEEVLYAERKPRVVPITATSVRNAEEAKVVADREMRATAVLPEAASGSVKADDYQPGGLVIHKALYGVGEGEYFDVTERLRSLVKDNSLDIIVNNSTLTPGQNPFRGKKKELGVTYSYDGGDSISVLRNEKDWLIIGQVRQRKPAPVMADNHESTVARAEAGILIMPAAKGVPMSAVALNDYLIRKFGISPQRLRAPMPIELRDFHRNDLAQLFAELGFKRGAEIGVAEGNFSEVICKVNPSVELYCIDPWSAYPTNPQNKSSERHEHAYNEAKRKLADYNARLIRKSSIDAYRDFDSGELEFLYVDGNHLYDFVSLDLILWSNKVRSGGIVSGDDYYQLDQRRWVGGGVVEAVQAYVNAHRIPIWWLFQGHKSVDFMWVKP